MHTGLSAHVGFGSEADICGFQTGDGLSPRRVASSETIPIVADTFAVIEEPRSCRFVPGESMRVEVREAFSLKSLLQLAHRAVLGG
jgi:hypothetical protein